MLFPGGYESSFKDFFAHSNGDRSPGESRNTGHPLNFQITMTTPTDLSRPPRQSDAAPNQATILFVEDEAVLAELGRVVLERSGYRVHTAASGAQALQVWAEHKGNFDMLVTDFSMPDGISGVELAATLQADSSRLRAIISSGYSLKDIHPSNDGDRFRFLPKPYSPSDLTRTIRGCFEEVADHPASVTLAGN